MPPAGTKQFPLTSYSNESGIHLQNSPEVPEVWPPKKINQYGYFTHTPIPNTTCNNHVLFTLLHVLLLVPAVQYPLHYAKYGGGFIIWKEDQSLWGFEQPQLSLKSLGHSATCGIGPLKLLWRLFGQNFETQIFLQLVSHVLERQALLTYCGRDMEWLLIGAQIQFVWRVKGKD